MKAERNAPAAGIRGLLHVALWATLALFTAFSAVALEVPYQVEISGVEDETLRTALEQNSGLIADAGRPPPTEAALRRRVEADLPRLAQVLDSFGYYGARIEYDLAAEGRPVRVTLRIAPGPLYRIGDYDISGPSPALTDGSIRIEANDLGLTRGAPAEAQAIVQSEARLLAALARQAYPLARITDEKVVVDHATQKVSVALKVDLGPKARFGPTEISGLDNVKPAFVEARLPWQSGAPFNADLVDQARTSLRETGLFASVAIDLADDVDDQGRLPMTVRLVEAKHRSIGAGLGWSTSDGFGAKLFWEHRNLLGTGELLSVTALGGETVNGLDLGLRMPGLDDTRFTYFTAAHIRDENRDAYDSQTAGASAGVEYAATPTLTLAGGVSLEYEDITDNREHSEFTLLGFPLSLTRDTSDNLFDPTRGNRLTASMTPYVSLLGDNTQFVVTRLSDSHYVSLTEDDSLIIAGWGRVGAIVGDKSTQIPATKRLYGGGGGSVRGFGYQMLGPIDDDGDPLGGRSQLELGTELRARVTEDFGGVVFIEGGNVYEDPLPDFDEEILWGAGVGLRYYTDLGPIRADIAFPLNPRDEDDSFQLYVSLGQAF